MHFFVCIPPVPYVRVRNKRIKNYDLGGAGKEFRYWNLEFRRGGEQGSWYMAIFARKNKCGLLDW